MTPVRSRPLIKVCGVTRPQDALLAAELGADLLGLNFYPGSPRCLVGREGDLGRALDLVEYLVEYLAGRLQEAPGRPSPAGRRPLLTGVFVNEEPGRVEEIADAVGLDLVQLHGDEDPETVARLGRRAVRVFRTAEPPGADELARTPDAWGFLFDLPASAAAGPAGTGGGTPYGGTGKTWQYEKLSRLEADRPVLVAGGIRPGNARRALESSGADGIDVCSGIESAPGVKDPDRMRRLFEEVRHGTP